MPPRYAWTGQYEMVRFNHYLPRPDVERLNHYAKLFNVPRSQLLRDALALWLKAADKGDV